MLVYEAVKKFCPFVKGFAENGYKCRVNGCMMWEPYVIMNKNYSLDKRETEKKYIDDPDNGDCGLKSKDLEVNI